MKKGSKMSEESRKKMSKSLIGNTRHFGKKHSTETRRKMSEALKGHKAWNKGVSFNVGEKHPNWKGGITPENNKIRNSLEIQLWRKSVFERDDFKCRKCINGGRLIAHHIRNFSEEIELRTSIENGITFCKNCHKEFHKKYGRKNNNREQINEFLR